MDDLRKIRIIGMGSTSRYYRVFLDDLDISRFVRAATVRIAVGEKNTVNLELVGDVELPGELIAIVTASQDNEYPPPPHQDDDE